MNMDVHSAVDSLIRKGCEVKQSGTVQRGDTNLPMFSLDISYARWLGNKSWGRIDFLTRKQSIGSVYVLVGMRSYTKGMEKLLMPYQF